jgi:hypothetical protein
VFALVFLGGALIFALVLLLAQAFFVLAVALPAVVAAFSARRSFKIPLYWVIALMSTIGLSLSVIYSEPVPLSDSEHRMDYWKAVALSWPVLTCLLGSLVCAGLARVPNHLIRAFSGASWGLVALAVSRQALRPVL